VKKQNPMQSVEYYSVDSSIICGIACGEEASSMLFL